MASKRYRIPVNPEVLRWARKTIGLPEKDVIRRFYSISIKDMEEKPYTQKTILEEIEKIEKNLTWAQLKKLATIYKRSPGELLLNKVPNEPRPENFDFRADQGKLIAPETRLAIRGAYEVQTLSQELDQSLGYPPPDNSVSLNTKKNLDEEAERIRNSFFPSIEEQKQWKNVKQDEREALENWKKSLEKRGILVLERSLTKNLDISGLSLAGSPPVILLNSKHSSHRKIFTLFHEYAHILFREKNPNALCSFFLANKNQGNEKDANRFSAEFLLPRSEIEKEKDFFNLNNLSEASKRYKVSEAVILRRLYDLGKINHDDYNQKNESLTKDYREWLKKQEERGGGGGGRRNYPQEKFRANGFSFTKKVISAYYSNEITFYSALAYLDIKSKYWDKIEEFVLENESVQLK